jgi:peroxiredoxin
MTRLKQRAGLFKPASFNKPVNLMLALKNRSLLPSAIMAVAVTLLNAKLSLSQSQAPSQPAATIAAATPYAALLQTAQFTSAKAPALDRGKRRPDFKLRDLQGNYRDLSEWDGKLIFLNFWATWCPPCVHEIPTFSLLQDQYAGAGVQFLGVALDNARDINRFIARHGMRYPSLHGAQDAIDLSKLYGNKHGSLPYTVVIGRDGVVLHTHAGVLERAQVLAMIRNAL